MSKETLPSVSIGIPTFNASKYIRGCLQSIVNQEYPAHKIEIIVVDGGSRNGTVEVCRRFPTVVLQDKSMNPDMGKLVSFQNAKGEIFFYMDADNKLLRPDWLERMTHPLVTDSAVVGSFTHHVALRSDPAINRYLSYDKLQRDPVLSHFSIGIEDTIVCSKDGYHVCKFSSGRTPPVGLVLYRRRDIETHIRFMKDEGMFNPIRFFDIDLPASLAKRGLRTFAYVPIGIHHLHASSLRELTIKRKRSLAIAFLPSGENRQFKWFDLSSPGSILKIIGWIIWANLVIPSALKGLYRAIKHRDPVLLYEPLVAYLVTDSMLVYMIADPRGRELLRNNAVALLARLNRKKKQSSEVGR